MGHRCSQARSTSGLPSVGPWSTYRWTGACSPSPAVAATLTGLVAGFAPALRASRVDLIRAIAKGGGGASGAVVGQRLTSGLVVAQVAMSLLLLACAGLFVRSGQNASTLDVGFRTDNLLLVSIDVPEQAPGFHSDVADEVEALPGVRETSWARSAPQAIGIGMNVVTLDGGAIPETDPIRLEMNLVDPAFFDTLDVPVIRGRGFRDEDGTDGRLVAVITETAARRLWPDQDAVGRRFFNPPRASPDRSFEVIGVVGDALLSMNISNMPAVVLLPFSNSGGPATLHVHTEGPATALASAVRDAIQRHDPTLAVFDVTSMDRRVYDNPILAFTRLGATVMGAFGGLGLLLAAVGLYGRRVVLGHPAGTGVRYSDRARRDRRRHRPIGGRSRHDPDRDRVGPGIPRRRRCDTVHDGLPS